MYTITVRETKSVRRTHIEWAVLTKGPDGREDRGYTPPIEVTKDETSDIYEQTVESLDLPAVIRAVNGMRPA